MRQAAPFEQTCVDNGTVGILLLAHPHHLGRKKSSPIPYYKLVVSHEYESAVPMVPTDQINLSAILPKSASADPEIPPFISPDALLNTIESLVAAHVQQAQERVYGSGVGRALMSDEQVKKRKKKRVREGDESDSSDGHSDESRVLAIFRQRLVPRRLSQLNKLELSRHSLSLVKYLRPVLALKFATMLLYREVQWQYTGKARTLKGKGASSGVGVRVYESPASEQPSYTFACQSVQGTFPLNQAVTLQDYILVFTRPPTADSLAPSVAATPASTTAAASGSVIGTSVASSSSGASAKRKAAPISITSPPQSPPRAPVGKKSKPNPKPKRSTATAAPPQTPPAPSKRRKVLLDEQAVAAPVALTSSAPVHPTSLVPVHPTSLAPVASTSTAPVAPTRVKAITPKEQEMRQRHREVLSQWRQEWVSRAEERHARERSLLKGPVKLDIEANGGDADKVETRLFKIVNGRIRERRRYGPPLERDSPARRHIAAHPETVKVLTQLTDDAVLEPTECEADGRGSEDEAAQYYLRSLVFPDAAALRTFLAVYFDKFGDECWVAATLRLFELSGVEGEAAVTLHYAGLTIRSTPGGRVDADSQSSGMSRCLNLLQLLVVHEFVELRLPASTATDANQRVIGDTEVALIAVIKPGSFNSPDGGRLLRVDPSALDEFARAVADLDATQSALDQLAPRDPVLDENDEQLVRMKRALDDSVSYYTNYEEIDAGAIIDRASEGGQRAYADIFANMSALRTRIRGRGFRSFEFLLTKDITASAVKGAETFSSGDNSARGPSAGYLIDHLVQGAPPSAEGWRDLTPSADLWAIILWHWLLLLALLFGIRVLHLAQPLLLVSHSGVVNRHLRQNFFRDLLDPDADGLASFLNADVETTPGLVDSIRSATFDLLDHADGDSNNSGWSLQVGSTAVVRYGPLGGHVALHVAQLHPDFFKYDPLVQDEAVSLFAAAAVKTALCRRILVERLVRTRGVVPEELDARLEFFRAVRQDIEQVALERGVEERLVSARCALADRHSALHSERKIAAYQRRVDADVKEEVMRRSARAHKASAHRSERPVFVGQPLDKADIAALDPYFVNHLLRPASLPDDCVHASPRLAALQVLLVAHGEACLDGLVSPAPQVAVGPVGSRPWCAWYLGGSEGVELVRSAAQAGNGRPRTWSEEVRSAYVEMCIAREALKRQARGLELRGQLQLVDVLRLLREDKSPTSAGTAGRGSRRDIFASTCRKCKRVFLDAHHALCKDRHACGPDTFTRVPVLFSSTLALLLDISLLALDDKGLPAYKEVTARSLVPDPLLGTLPFEAGLDPMIQIALGTRPELLVPLAIDALVVTSRTGFAHHIGGQRDAWSNNYEDSLHHLFRGILRHVPLATDFCITCLKSRVVPSDTVFEQHLCDPAKIERGGRMIANRARYAEDYRSLLPLGESLLLLGPEPYRRTLYAMTDPRDKALSAFILGLERHGEASNDPVVKDFLSGLGTKDEHARMEVFAQQVLGWRQP
ncbi:hypothetical protein JCM3774_004518 [Rhodotorula dairenensis]